MKCQHCNKKPVVKGSHLCPLCFLRHRYINLKANRLNKSVEKVEEAARSNPSPVEKSLLPIVPKRVRPEPTHYLPGSEDKVKVLIERASRNQELWHPNDARFSTD